VIWRLRQQVDAIRLLLVELVGPAATRASSRFFHSSTNRQHATLRPSSSVTVGG